MRWTTYATACCWLAVTCLIGKGECIKCYYCITLNGVTSSNPGLQGSLNELNNRYPPNTQCANYPYHQTNTIQTMDCKTLSYDMGFNLTGLGGMPFTGWMCGKQTYSVILKNFADDVSVSVPVTIRGCVPVQSGNPYEESSCWGMVTDNTNPYIMGITHGLTFLQYSVAPQDDTLDGRFCMCWGDHCNAAPRRPGRQFVALTLALGALIVAGNY